MDSRRGWSAEQVTRYNRERFEDLVNAGWDLVVIDEAHRLGGSSETVARYRLGEGLAQASLTCCCSPPPHTRARPMLSAACSASSIQTLSPMTVQSPGRTSPRM